VYVGRRKANRKSAVNHDKCLAQLRQLEKEFNAQINEKDVLISEMKEANDDLKRQVDQLTLESEGLNQTIQAG
jgi:peptidoglycan hydrolase CwlO-like protein